MREIQLSNQQKFAVYDTSGIYTDTESTLNADIGLPRITQTMVASEKGSQHAIILCETGNYYPGNGICRHSRK